jgi:hypothetical protein
MRGFKTALLIRDNYGKLLAAGLAVTFALQVFITAGGVMRVIPMTGLPMPFLAAGGSALVANWVLIAALIRLSDAARRPPPPAIPLTEEELRAMRLASAIKMPTPTPAVAPQAPASAAAATIPVPPPASPAEEQTQHYSQPRPRPQHGEPTMIRAGEPTEVVPPASSRKAPPADPAFDEAPDDDDEQPAPGPAERRYGP